MTLGFSHRTMYNNRNIVGALVLVGCCLLGIGQAYQDDLARTFAPLKGGRTTKTTQLLNQLCNESQDDDSMQRDACYGCFFRASIASPGYPMLGAMAACADRYLNNTDYGHCSAFLKNATTTDANGTPMTIYCTFFQCVRQVNKDTLVSLKHIDHKTDGVTHEEKLTVKRKRSALETNQYIIGIKGICVAQPSNQITPTRPNQIRNTRKHHWGHRRTVHRNYRRSFRQDPNVHRRGPRNVFQFFIDGRQSRQAFRQHDRLYSRQNQMRRYESNYRRY